MEDFINSTRDTPDPREMPWATLMEEGEVIGNALDPWNNPILTVRIRGGRRIDGVIPLTGIQGGVSGERPRAPQLGAQGVVVFPQRNRGQLRAFWIGGIPFTADGGLHCDDPSASVSLEPSGAGRVQETNGNHTRWDGNGDFEYTGSDQPKRPSLRDGKLNVIPAPVTERFYRRLLEYGRSFLWRLRLGADLILSLDGKKRVAALFVGDTGLEIKDGMAGLRAETVRLGTRDSAMRSLALAPPVNTTLHGMAKELALVKSELRSLQTAYNSFNASYVTHVHAETSLTTLPPTGAVPSPVAPIFSPNDVNTNGEVKVLDIASKVVKGE